MEFKNSQGSPPSLYFIFPGYISTEGSAYSFYLNLRVLIHVEKC